MSRRPWHPCCKPCPECPVCVPGTYASTYAAVVDFKGFPTEQTGCDCTANLIGPSFELRKIGVVTYPPPDPITCCEYEYDYPICWTETADAYFTKINFAWCEVDALHAQAVLTLDYVCEVLTDPPGHTGVWRFNCVFDWSWADQTKRRYCNDPVRLLYDGHSDAGCTPYSLCNLFDVYVDVTFLPPGPGLETQCIPPAMFTAMSLWGAPSSAYYA